MTSAPEPTPEGAAEPLPFLLTVTEEFTQRMPSQRVLDMLDKFENGTPFVELVQRQPFRIVAFRALLRDFPDRDAASLWLHSYDVELDQKTADPTNGKSTMPALGSAGFGT